MSAQPISANRRVARAATTVMAAFIVSNLLGLLRQILVARAFGTTPEMEAFTAANRVSETIFALVAGGALASSFIPTFTGLLTLDKKRQAWQLASAISNLALIVLGVISFLAALFAPQIVTELLAPGFASDPAKQALTISLLRLMLPSAVIFGLSGLVMGMLNAHQVFFIPALAPAMYPLGIIFGVLFLAPSLGIYGLAWGVLIGATLHLGLQVPSLLRLKGQYFPILGLKLEPVREVIRLLGPRLLGVAVVQLNFWVNVRLASYMAEGSVYAVQLGFALMLMPQAAIAQSVATAAMPTLSAQYAQGLMGELRSTLAASLRGMLLLAIPASLGLILLRQPLIVLLFQHGEFTAESTTLVAWALLWYALGLVGHCLVELLARAFYALHDTRTPVAVGVVVMSLNVVFSVLFSALFTRLGWPPHGGLALANTLATALEAAGLWVFMRRRLDGLEGKYVLQGSLQALAASLVMGLGLAAWLRLSSNYPAWLVVGGGLVVGGLLFGLVVLGLRNAEALGLLRLLRRRLSISRP
jgi:putative peptidoglycan lipid II flippase